MGSSSCIMKTYLLDIGIVVIAMDQRWAFLALYVQQEIKKPCGIFPLETYT